MKALLDRRVIPLASKAFNRDSDHAISVNANCEVGADPMPSPKLPTSSWEARGKLEGSSWIARMLSGCCQSWEARGKLVGSSWVARMLSGCCQDVVRDVDRMLTGCCQDVVSRGKLVGSSWVARG